MLTSQWSLDGTGDFDQLLAVLMMLIILFSSDGVQLRRPEVADAIRAKYVTLLHK